MRKKHLPVALFTAALLLFAACNSQPVQDNQPEAITQAPTPTVKAALEISLSGNAGDSFVAEEDCYVEGTDVVLYFQKGLTVRGDMLAIAETAMKNLCETSGLSFDPDNQPANVMDCRDMYYEPGIFEEVNKDNQKINLLVVDLEDSYIQWAADHNAILDITDFDYEPSHHETIYHELVHVLQFRSGLDLGSTMNEGYAVYITDKFFNEHGDRRWDTAQFFYPAFFDETLISGGESTFKYQYSYEEFNESTNYNYGFRLITFLVDTYGIEVYRKILAEAVNQKFDSSYRQDFEEEDKAENTRLLVSIIKSQTSDDVFTRFTEWYQNSWSALAEAYMNQMESITAH